jgi:hypothetical protein
MTSGGQVDGKGISSVSESGLRKLSFLTTLDVSSTEKEFTMKKLYSMSCSTCGI